MSAAMKLKEPPVAIAEMLIRRPVGEVFEAFVDPAITSKFWFTHGSGRLDGGKRHPLGVADVRLFHAGRGQGDRARTSGSWWNGAKQPTTVEWTFTPMERGTFVSIRNFGFSGEPDQRVKQAIDSAEGFSLVLAGAKAWLEHGLVAWHGRRPPSQRLCQPRLANARPARRPWPSSWRAAPAC